MPSPVQIRTKPIHADSDAGDGIRILVDRLPQGGRGKENYAVDACLTALAPSEELSTFAQHHRQPWQAYRKLYLKALRRPEAAGALNELYQLASRGNALTLLFTGKDSVHNSATVLRDLLEGLRKPPTGTGPLRPLPVRQSKRLKSY